NLRARWQEEAKGKGDYVSWVAGTIGRGLDVKPSRESNVIDITYEGADPMFSAALANAFAQAYIDSTVQIRVDPARRYADFFEERAHMARDKLEAAQTKLAEAQKAKGIVITEERLDVEMARLTELSSQITALRALKAESGSRSAIARDNPDRVQDVLNNTVVASLKSDLSRQEAHLDELLARYGEAHPLVREAQANIDTLKQRLRSETGRVTTSVSLNNNINVARESEAVRAYEEQRARVLKLKEDRTELQVLEREVESAQRIYESIQQRLSQINLESNSNQSSIYLLSPATEPLKPSSPKVFINTLVAATLGTFIAIMVALGVETLNRRVRGPFDLVQALELPVLGVLPSPKNRKPFWQRLGKSSDLNLGRPKALGASTVTTAIETV
ncbi:MAG: GNVR domain-containing protein, partial [Aquabacterium sp.]